MSVVLMCYLNHPINIKTHEIYGFNLDNKSFTPSQKSICCYDETMHELPVSQEILKVLQDEAKKRNARIKGVKLRIGRLSGNEPNSISFFLEVLTKGTDMEGLKVESEIVDPVLLCNACKKEFTVDDIIFICPHCGSIDCKMLSGGDLEIVTISLED